MLLRLVRNGAALRHAGAAATYSAAKDLVQHRGGLGRQLYPELTSGRRRNRYCANGWRNVPSPRTILREVRKHWPDALLTLRQIPGILQTAVREAAEGNAPTIDRQVATATRESRERLRAARHGAIAAARSVAVGTHLVAVSAQYPWFGGIANAGGYRPICPAEVEQIAARMKIRIGELDQLSRPQLAAEFARAGSFPAARARPWGLSVRWSRPASRPPRRSGTRRWSSPAGCRRSKWFGAVWTALYILMAVAAWLVWRERYHRARTMSMSAYAAQLLLNALFAPAFFGLKSIGAGLFDIIALWIAVS